MTRGGQVAFTLTLACAVAVTWSIGLRVVSVCIASTLLLIIVAWVLDLARDRWNGTTTLPRAEEAPSATPLSTEDRWKRVVLAALLKPQGWKGRDDGCVQLWLCEAEALVVVDANKAYVHRGGSRYAASFSLPVEMQALAHAIQASAVDHSAAREALALDRAEQALGITGQSDATPKEPT